MVAAAPRRAHLSGPGLLLPCNVCVWQEEAAAVVSIARPEAMFAVVNRPGLEPLVGEASERLGRALAALDTLVP